MGIVNPRAQLLCKRLRLSSHAKDLSTRPMTNGNHQGAGRKRAHVESANARTSCQRTEQEQTWRVKGFGSCMAKRCFTSETQQALRQPYVCACSKRAFCVLYLARGAFCRMKRPVYTSENSRNSSSNTYSTAWSGPYNVSLGPRPRPNSGATKLPQSP